MKKSKIKSDMKFNSFLILIFIWSASCSTDKKELFKALDQPPFF